MQSVNSNVSLSQSSSSSLSSVLILFENAIFIIIDASLLSLIDNDLFLSISFFSRWKLLQDFLFEKKANLFSSAFSKIIELIFLSDLKKVNSDAFSFLFSVKLFLLLLFFSFFLIFWNFSWFWITPSSLFFSLSVTLNNSFLFNSLNENLFVKLCIISEQPSLLLI